MKTCLKAVIAVFASIILLIGAASAQVPAWWTEDPETNFFDASVTDGDYAPANVGQLKNVASRAKVYLDKQLAAVGGAGTAVTSAVNFTPGSDYAPINVGQLKNVAKPFYDRLYQVGYNWQTKGFGVPSQTYPWTGTTHSGNSAPANVGQLKNVFSFDLELSFLTADNDPNTSGPPGDGLPDYYEKYIGTSYTNRDVNANNIPDGAEFANGFDPASNPNNVNYSSVSFEMQRVMLEVSGPARVSPGIDGTNFTEWLQQHMGNDQLHAEIHVMSEVYNDEYYSKIYGVAGHSTFYSVYADSLNPSHFSSALFPKVSASTGTRLTFEDFNNYLLHPNHFKSTYPWVGVGYNTSGPISGGSIVAEAGITHSHGNYMWQTTNSSMKYIEIEPLAGTGFNYNGPNNAPIVAGVPGAFILGNLRATTTTTSSYARNIPVILYTLSAVHDYPSMSTPADFDEEAFVQIYTIPAGLNKSNSTQVKGKLVGNTMGFDYFLADGEAIAGSNTALLVPQQSQSSLVFNEIGGSKYRKVSLLGRPIPDEKPQSADESDAAPENTYVDALTRQLSHYTSDLFVPLGSSSFNLQATRRLKSETWQKDMDSGGWDDGSDHIGRQAALPFGASWTSNITSYLVIDQNANAEGIKTATVVDSDGQSFRFMSQYGSPFFPIPSGLADAKTYLFSLSAVSGTQYRLSKKFGQASTFNLLAGYASAALGLGKDKNVFRLTTVEDNDGGKLTYEYAVSDLAYPNPLIPFTIKDGRSGHSTSLSITQTPAPSITGHWSRVATVSAGTNRTAVYEYDNQSSGHYYKLLRVKQDVARPGSGVVNEKLAEYTYELKTGALEATGTSPGEPERHPARSWHHLNLRTLKDGANRTWTFDYTVDRSKFTAVRSRLIVPPAIKHLQGTVDSQLSSYSAPWIGISYSEPLIISSIGLPGGGSVSFYKGQSTNGATPGWQLTQNPDPGSSSNYPYLLTVNHVVEVRDAEGGRTRYSFGDIAAPGGTGGSRLVRPKPIPGQQDGEIIAALTHMRIDYLNQVGGIMGSEKFEFELEAGMALKKVTDFSGNITLYEYADTWSWGSTEFKNFFGGSPPGGSSYVNFLKYDDPTKETKKGSGEYGDREKIFSYISGTRALSTVRDIYGDTRTSYTFRNSSSTLRTSEKIYNTSAASGGGIIKQTDWQYGHGTYPAFVTKKTVQNTSGTSTNVSAIVTDYAPVIAGNGKGMVLSETVVLSDASHQADNIVTSYEYDAFNNKTRVYHPRHQSSSRGAHNGSAAGHRTTFVYDTRNRLVKTTQESGTLVEDGLSVSMPEENVEMWYDASGRKIKELDARDNTTLFKYNTMGLLSQQISDLAGSVAAGNDYDRSAAVVVSFAYDKVGRKTQSADPRGVITKTEYDTIGRPVRVTTGGPSLLTPDKLLDAGAPNAEYQQIFKYSGKNAGGSVFDISGFKPTTIQRQRGVSGISDDVTTIEYNCFYQEVSKTLSHSDGRGGSSSYKTTTQYYPALAGGSLLSPSVAPAPLIAPGGLFAPKTAVEVIDPLSGSTITWYDAGGRAVQQQFDDGRTIQKIYTGYDAVWSELETHPSYGGATRQHYTLYDGAGRPYRKQSPSATHYQETSLNSGTWSSSSSIIETRTWYDTAGNVIMTSDPRDPNRLGSPTPPSFPTIMEYDSRNRLRRTIQPAALNAATGTQQTSITTNTYDLNGNLTAVKDPLGKTTTTEYDIVNRPKKVLLPSIPVSPWGTNPPGPSSVPTSPPSPSFPITQTFYDRAGNAVKVTDANEKETLNAYDAHGRLWKTTDPNGAVTEFAYDAAGNKMSVKDPRAKTSTFTYDGMNRVTSFTPEGKPSITTVYNDVLGAVTQVKKNGRNQTSTTSFNTRGQITNVSFSGASVENLAYSYDYWGNLLSVTHPGTAGADRTDVSYTYDILNRVVSETSTEITHVYDYDSAGNRTRVTLNTNGTADAKVVFLNGYDSRNRLRLIKEQHGSTILNTVYEYDRANRVAAIENANGWFEQRVYDDAGRLKTQETKLTRASSTLRRKLQYWHDAVGNLRAIFDGTAHPWAKTLMGYDAGGRLLHETFVATGGTEYQTHYLYDAGSNRTREWRYTGTIWGSHGEGSSPPPTSYSYGDFNELLSAGAASFGYDNDGNRTSKTVASVTTTYTYDRLNRLVSVSNPSNPSFPHAYAYDYRSRRVWRKDAGQTTAQSSWIVFAGGTSVQEYLDANFANPLTAVPEVMYARGNDQGGGVGGLLYSLRKSGGAWTPAINSYNARGDVIGQGNAAGASTYQTWLQADGRTQAAASTTGSTLDRQKANTKEHDPTGFLNEGFRYRDLDTGVFLTRDPAGFIDGPNLYTYVKQNPWTMFDPQGLAMFGLFNTWGDYGREIGEVWKGYGDVTVGAVVGTLKSIKDLPSNAIGISKASIDMMQMNATSVAEGFKTAGKEAGGAVSDAVSEYGERLASGDNRAGGQVIGTGLGIALTKGMQTTRSAAPIAETIGTGSSGGQGLTVTISASEAVGGTQAAVSKIAAKGGHQAKMTVLDTEGAAIHTEGLVSGGTGKAKPTFSEQGAVHTEAKGAAKVREMIGGGTQVGGVLIEGQLPPCNMCKGTMNKLHRDTGVPTTYVDGQGSLWESAAGRRPSPSSR